MGSDILIPKSTAHQTLTCLEALIEFYRRQPPEPAARTIGDLVEFRDVMSQSVRSSRDRTTRVAAVTLVRISDRLAACAQAEIGPDEMQAALWRMAGRLDRWVIEATPAPPKK
ncbi:hypothetical protein [Mycobacterium sp. M26]|uniref:hypothetical protein n=1 Tax=Mycobacterium sp. M26 TaxID=1762962 RepID=UPI00073F372E|nr:hypothetical protein [Mycobacterium sp. M26]